MRYEDSGSVCSFSDYIDELEHEIVGKDAQFQVAKHLVRELVRAVEFYGNETNWDDRILLMLSDCQKTRIHDYCGGLRARTTLKQNADKIKSLLGE